MSADYNLLFQPPEGAEIADEAAAPTDYDVNAPSAMPPMPTSPPEPRVQAPPPMPVDWTQEAPPARPEPSPARPEPRTQAPTHLPRHTRRGQDDPATPDYELRADSQHGQKKAATGSSMPLRPDPPALALAPNGEPAELWKRSEPNLPPPAVQPSTAKQRLANSPAVRNGRRRTDPQAAVQPGSAPTATNGDHRGKGMIAAFAGTSVADKPVARMVPQRGWRRSVYRLTRINLGLSRDEKHEIDLHTRIRRNIRGSYQIGVIGLKGGAGKTATTAALGSVFAQVRGDRILAIDANPVSGNLADRVGRQSTATIADLVANRALSHYNDIRAHTSMNAVNLEVLSAADYTAPRYKLSEEDWRAVGVVPRYYNLVLADCGADLFGPATRGVLSSASGLVIVSSASIDGARQAAVAIDWLRHNKYHALLNRTCLVINDVAPGEPNVAVADLVRRFEQDLQPGRVIVLPWDKHVAVGTEIQVDLLGDTYKRRILELAAALSDDFDRGERR